MVSVKINLNQNLSMLGFLTLSDHWGIFVLFIIAINIGNRTECSPIQPVIIRVINKIGQPRSGSPICQSRVWLHTELSTRSRQCCQLIKTRHRLYVFLRQKKNNNIELGEMRDNSVHTWRALSIFLYFIFITLMRDFVSRVHLRGGNNILTISRSQSQQNLFFGLKKKKNEKRITSFYNGLVWYIGGFLRSNVCLGDVRPGANSCYSWRAAILSINPLL